MKIDLTTEYLGLPLQHPLIVSSGPLTGEIASLELLQRAGAAAVILPSLFEEQIERDELEIARLYDFQSETAPESLSYFPELDDYNTGPDRYLELIAGAKQRLTIPVIASLNGSTLGGWLHYAKLVEQAGADALELNLFSLPTEPGISPEQISRSSADLVHAVCQDVSIPVAVKLGPYFSSLAYEAARLAEAGAAGLVLFNRFLAPDIDTESLTFHPQIELSRPEELRLALRWIAILRDQIPLSLAATGGVHEAVDVAKALLVGADAVTLTSTLLIRGADHLETLRSGLADWMREHEYRSVEQMKGSMSRARCPNPEALSRANYLRALTSYTPVPGSRLPQSRR